MGKELVCKVCRKVVKKVVKYKSKDFCTKKCVNKFKKSEEKGVCEFC